MKIFIGFMVVCFFSIVGSTLMSYLILKRTAEIQSQTEMQNKTDALKISLDYAVSHTIVKEENLPDILQNKIYEIADINKYDVIIYNLKGSYLLSNKDKNQVAQQQIPQEILQKVLSKSETRVDIVTYDEKIKSNLVSSYMLLKNNMLEPIAIVYFPFYHNDDASFDVFNKYLQYIVVVNIILIALSIWLSWIISKNLTKTITKISDLITRTTLFDKELKPIKYFRNDELSSLVKSYNKMIYQIEEQKQLLAYREKEEAWREMAKQVAHEVKNPLTPMKLQIQNFQRKFDKNDPEIEEKVKNLSKSMVDQIDLIATVAGAFSEFAKLPETNNETINLNYEINALVRIFNDDNIFLHTNKEIIMMNIDRIYLSRIITNLITNAKQAVSDDRKSIINIDIELFNKKVTISVEDNGIGIPKNQLEQIFEPNFTTKTSGTGLGLTMVRKMVEEYKGEISVKSEVGKGTKFTLILPTNI